MTNTLNNVPRELLADFLCGDHDKRIMAERHLLAMLANAPSPADHVEDVRTMVAKPSPAGVDGLPEFLTPELEAAGRAAVERATQDGCNSSRSHAYVYGEAIRKSVVDDAQAIIDGLRGEVDVVRAASDNYKRIANSALEQRDQLAGMLREAKAMLDPFNSGVCEMQQRIDAALAELPK